MSASALGNKHICTECGTRFYDLHKDPAACPKCGTIAQVSAGIMSSMHDAPEKDDDDDELDLRKFDMDDDDFVEGSSFDTIETLDEDSDDDIESLSELDDRDRGGLEHAGHDDDVEESQLMDDMEDYDNILDDADDMSDEELRA